MYKENYLQLTFTINYYEILLEEIQCDKDFVLDHFDNNISYSRKQSLKTVLDDIYEIQKYIKDLYFLREIILKVEKSQRKINRKKRLCNL